MRSGFSLVELSIVLVILGLLTGGILSGQSLIRAAELRSVTTEFQTYQTAVTTFRDRFFALPGDMPNATSFWGKDNALCPTHNGAAGTPGTCNGNADGILVSQGGVNERFQFWKQISLAGFIEGSFTGLQGSGGTIHAIIGENVPKSKLSNAGWTVHNTNTIGDTGRYDYDYGNHFIFGGDSSSGLATIATIINPEEAWNIDVKIDDGRPGYGNLIAYHWNNACANASSSTDYDSDYRVNDTSRRCALIFRGLL